MFIYNVKINGTKTFKIFLIIVILILLVLVGSIVFKLFNGAITSGDPYSTSSNIYQLNTNNYTNVLKAVHDDLDNYIGTKFSFTGYVYSVYDLTDTQFILARDMIISSNLNYVVVGFLCEYEDTSKLSDGSWITITGEIQKGDYHGELPIVHILSLEETTCPIDEYVYPPDDTYLPTSRKCLIKLYT